MRRIWFKPDCVEWIRAGKKTTTFRARQHNGRYEIVHGSRFKPNNTGMIIRLTPIKETDQAHVLAKHFKTEGDFKTIQEFRDWLAEVHLYLPATGWLHSIELLEAL